jgi:hypothetical protein
MTSASACKAYMAYVTMIPLLIIDDLGMRKLPPTAAEDLLEIVMRRYERGSTRIKSNRPVGEEWIMVKPEQPHSHPERRNETKRTLTLVVCVGLFILGLGFRGLSRSRTPFACTA